MKSVVHVLRAHWGRTLMAIAQIGVAVGAVVAIVATGIPTLMGMGMGSAPLLEVTYGPAGQQPGRFGEGLQTLPVFTAEDAAFVAAQSEAVEAAAIYDTQFVTLIQAGDSTYAVRGHARVTPQFERLAGLTMVAGDFFGDADMQESPPRVALLSQPVARALFGEERSALGQTIRLRPGREARALMGFGEAPTPPGEAEEPQPLRVVGVFRPLAGHAVFQDVAFLVPAAGNPTSGPAGSSPLRRGFSALYVKPRPGRVREAEESVRLLLQPRLQERAANAPGVPQGPTPPGRPNEVMVREPQLLATLRQVLTWQMAALVGVGALAAVVSGIAVLTVSLVNVTEQTRAIALRRALGATRRRVMVEVLAQSVVLSGLGGVLGMALGWPLGRLFEPVLPNVNLFGGRLGEAYAAVGWAVALPAGLLLALVIGALAGLYPAWDASRTPPARLWHDPG